ncbi:MULTISPECIES: hypothetical protein [unclassified Streptomyces]|uniref:hypothetical protein n=1 Tax=Streptomyces TaxID=1883 RepID=UPI001369D2A3|nr:MULTISPECIES: hypothetical protein [unclassified Streptomyces]MYY87079.1 hypothetical protein [Streptomyces sp. SID335]MYZ18127.1 hypothetical protein [Streptomyces sp. SID337]NDZ89500.1 hypothetical protein [Streptomyces sp. SID10115]NEA05118.1 hypothetical protein [Streptomyces sp. SID10116]
MTTTDEDLIRRLMDLIKERIAQAAGIDAGNLEDDVLLFPDLAPDLGIDIDAPDVHTDPQVSLDSLDILDMLVAFEESFGVRYRVAGEGAEAVSPGLIATPRRIASFILSTVPPEQVAAGLRARRPG